MLALAQRYNTGDVIIRLCCPISEKNKQGSALFNYLQLEKEDLVNIVLIESKDDPEMLEIDQMSLTVKGHQLHEELKNKSTIGSLKERVKSLIWVVLTTICTTLIVLTIKGV